MRERYAGPGLLSYLLQQRKPENLTVPLLKTMDGLLRACQPAEGLSQDILRHLLLNLDLWNPAPLDTQQHLLKLLHKLGQVCYGNISLQYNAHGAHLILP